MKEDSDKVKIYRSSIVDDALKTEQVSLQENGIIKDINGETLGRLKNTEELNELRKHSARNGTS